MTKEAYYFSHDSNARNDPKCSALISDFGMEGYGVFWMMIEILSEQEGYKLKKFNKLYTGLARQMMADENKLRSIIEALLEDYELLLEDDKYIWSESLLRRMEIKEAKRQSKVEAGRLGGLQSGLSRKQAKKGTKQNEAPLEANEPKERKGKESKVIIPPTIEQVKTYCTERKNQVDAEKFIDFYSSKGWMIGKNKMKDWKASVRTWERQDKPTENKTPHADAKLL